MLYKSMKAFLTICVFVFEFTKHAFKGVYYIGHMLIEPFNKKMQTEKTNKTIKGNREAEMMRRKIARKQKQLEQQQIRLEARRVKNEKRIEAEKIKEQKKLDAQIKKQQDQNIERSKRLEERLKLAEEKALKKAEEKKIKEAARLEARKLREQKQKEKSEEKLRQRLEREEKQLALRAERDRIRREKYAEINAKKEEAEQIKQQSDMKSSEKRAELERIKSEQKELERQQKIEEVREITRLKEEESYRKAKEREEKKAAKLKLIEEKKEAKKARIQAKKDQKHAIKEARTKNKEAYVNENVEIERPNAFASLVAFKKKLDEIPHKIKDKIVNNSFAKNARNKKDISRQALLIDFESEDAKKSDIKLLYEYEAKDREGKFIKGYFEAYSRVEVHSFLLSEGYEVYSIKTNKWITLLHGGANVNKVKFKNKDLIFFLAQLSTYLKAGITLVESLRILSRQFAKQKKYEKIFKSIIYELTMGENFSDALEKQNVAFPKLLINMVRTAEMTGELPEVLDNMVEYYTEMDETRRQFITAMTYPTLVFVFALVVITFILIYVVPQFYEIYNTMEDAEIPAFTNFVMNCSYFLQNNYIWLISIIIILISTYVVLYKKVRFFRTINQWMFMHIPAIGTTMIYSEVATFSKTFSSLLSHNVPITECMSILNKITNNEIYKMLILDVVSNLAEGGKVSDAFEGHWAFPIPAYEMICTGERTGELPDMLARVSSYYQSLQKNAVTRIKTFIEPILTIFLTVIVGAIILAVIIPMFNMYQAVQSY